MFTYQQYLSALRWGLNAGGVYLVSRGYGNSEIWIAASGLVLSSSSFIWGMIRHTKVGTLLAADDVPEVAGVILKPTGDGIALATAVPKATVTPAGSPAAISIARAA